jgi:hypothetical protein
LSRRFVDIFVVLYSGHKRQATNFNLKATAGIQLWFSHFYLPINAMASQNGAADPIHAFMQHLTRSGPNDHINNADDGGSIEDHDSQGDRSGDDESGDMPEEGIDQGLDRVGSFIPARPVAVICQQLKQRKNLSPESEAELDVFAASDSINSAFRTL